MYDTHDSKTCCVLNISRVTVSKGANKMNKDGVRPKSNIGTKSEDNIYEDDGFFSDVPATGSLSKSQRALNKYMKTNLLYENGEDKDNDRAYFSKETSPNESVSKCDSESTVSEESFEKTTSPLSEMTNKGPINDIIAISTQKHSIPKDYKPSAISQTPDNVNIEPNLETAAKSDDKRKPIYHSSSDLTQTIVPKQIEERQATKTILREKNNNIAPSENRHTVHDFSDWGNRTNVQPDVYAPLPYSK